ncbi:MULTISPECIES: hypothetical protein [Prochlorococcus]|uniref:hypothetical protein n=1 Tax=Prochlorococcus TaxID=1218 RepID=UPI001F39BBEB|nr:hypothetical protein [Prochlorococcus marinus]
MSCEAACRGDALNVLLCSHIRKAERLLSPVLVRACNHQARAVSRQPPAQIGCTETPLHV